MSPPFEYVVRRHGPTVLRVCRALLPGPDADDAWSETFLSALRAWPDLPEDANVEAWLVTIAHRKAIDAIRAGQRRAVPVPDLPEDTQPATEPATDLWAAVRRLPDRQRQVIAYRYLGGLTYPQVADLIGGTADAARRAGHDGLATLRRTYPIGDLT